MAKLQLIIGASITALNSALGQAKSAVKSFSNSVGGMLAGVVGTTALIAFGKSAIDAADQVADGSRKIGVSAEEYQKLRYAAEQSGAGIETVETAFKKMSSTVTDAINGSKTAEATLNALGVTLADVKGKTPNQLFELMATALSEVTDKTQQAAMAQDIFGKSGMQLIPMLGSFKELGKEIQDVGGIMSNEAVKAADEFNDSMNKLGTTLKAGFMNSGLVEYLKTAAEGFNALVSASKQVKDAKGKDLYADQGTNKFDQSMEFLGNMVTGGNFTRLTEKANKFKTGSDSVFTTPALPLKPKAENDAERLKAEEEKRKREALRQVNAEETALKAEMGKQNIPAEEQKRILDVYQEQKKASAPKEVKAEEKPNPVKDKLIDLQNQAGDKEFLAQMEKDNAKYAEEERQNQKKIEDGITGTVTALQRKIEIQKLLNKGLDREAAIQEAVNEAQDKAGKDAFGNQNEIDPAKLEQIKAGTGEMFDLTKEKIKPLQMEAPTITDSVKRIGGSIGGASNVNFAKDQLTVQKDISTILKDVRERMVTNQAGNVWA